jgi:uncharacterized membrane protein YedE/YeeE
MQIVFALLAGLVFGIGLILSGMTDPSKVIGFLDLAGKWDPSLGLVMTGALAVGVITFRFTGQRQQSLLGEPMRLPTAKDIDRRLVLGSLVFGVGWGLAGFCPGPAVVNFATGNSKAVIFMIAMLAGMAIFELSEKLLSYDASSRRNSRMPAD